MLPLSSSDSICADVFNSSDFSNMQSICSWTAVNPKCVYTSGAKAGCPEQINKQELSTGSSNLLPKVHL